MSSCRIVKQKVVLSSPNRKGSRLVNQFSTGYRSPKSCNLLLVDVDNCDRTHFDILPFSLVRPRSVWFQERQVGVIDGLRFAQRKERNLPPPLLHVSVFSTTGVIHRRSICPSQVEYPSYCVTFLRNNEMKTLFFKFYVRKLIGPKLKRERPNTCLSKTTICCNSD